MSRDQKKIHHHNCPNCKNGFDSTRAAAKFCSRKCSAQANKHKARRRMKIRWQKMTPNERSEFAEKKSQQIKAAWSRLSPEAYEERIRNFESAQREKAANLTPKERASLRRRSQRAWDNASPELREQHRRKVSHAQKTRWSSMSEEQYNLACQRMRASGFSAASYLKQSTPERILMEALDKRQFRYTGLDRKRSHGEPISADIIHPRTKTIILVDGCYFHECPDHGSGKFPEKPAYDREVTRKAEMAGWKVLRFWSHDICDHATISPRLLDVLQRIYEAVS